MRRSTSGLFGPFSRISDGDNGITNGDRSNWVTPYTLDPTSPSTIFLGTHRMYRSTDYGDNFTQVGPADMTQGGTLLSIDVNRNFPNSVAAGTNDGKVWRSVDNGLTWTEITTGLPGRSINDIAHDPTTPNRLFAVVGGFNTDHLWEWNQGSGWVARPSGLPNVPTNTVLMLDDSTMFVGNDVGVYRSDDSGLTFLPFMSSMPEGTVVTDLKYTSANDTITAGTYGRGAWQVPADPIGPLVLYDSFEQPLTEVDGDGDASIEPGETWQVKPILRNVGSDTAGQVTARLATDTPGITLTADDVKGYGDIVSGGTAPAVESYTFVVDPDFPCGTDILFDIVDIASLTPAKSYSDIEDAFSIGVVDEFGDPIFETIVDENFDSTADWTHEGFDPGFFFCTLPYVDEWNVATKDAAHGPSYHSGNGPGGTYSRANYSWLYYAGKDSLGGVGVDLPATARTVTLTIQHWYDTQSEHDGGSVLIDTAQDGQDVYTSLTPVGGYSPGMLTANRCNGHEGQEAFHGNSGGWITSQFDLSDHIGKRVYLAFVFGSDSGSTGNGEGWYIDDIQIETETEGAPICQISPWPGKVPADVCSAKSARTFRQPGTRVQHRRVPGSAVLDSGWRPARAGGGWDVHACRDRR